MTGPIQHERTEAWLGSPVSYPSSLSPQPTDPHLPVLRGILLLPISDLQGSGGLRPVRQGSGDSYKNKHPPSSLAYRLTSQRSQLGWAQAGWPRCLPGLAGRRLSGAGGGGGSMGQRGYLGWCGVTGPSAAANVLCKRQQGLTLSVSKLRAFLADHIWRLGSRIGAHLAEGILSVLKA